MSTDANSDEEQLLSHVPEDRAIGNSRLQEHLKWESDKYWEVRNRLIDKGVLEKGRGRGGAVSRVQTGITEIESAPISQAIVLEEIAQKARESDLYEPIRAVLVGEWAKDARADDVFAEITATQGSRATGKWARPDLTLGMVRTFPYVPGKHVDIVVFEVKPHWAVDVTAVYEAIGQRRAANRAYVIFALEAVDREELLDDICAEARKFGIGVIVAADPGNFATWTVKEDASRTEPDAERLNEFLAVQVTQPFREKLMKWWK